MEQILSFLINNEKVVWATLTVIIFGIIYALKIPYKKLTSKITNNAVRQLANKVIVLLTFAVGILVTVAYSKIVGVEFSFVDSIKYASSAIALYSATEIKKGNTDVAFETEEGKAVVEAVIEAVIPAEQNQEEKTKKGKKEKKEKTKKEKKSKKTEQSTVKTENASAKDQFLTYIGQAK